MVRTIVLTAFVLLGFSSLVHAADLEGVWQGTWTKNGDALPVNVTFEKTKAGYSGHFDSDALQVADIPFKDIRWAPPSAHWVLQGDSSTSTYDGSLNGDALSGEFTDGTAKGSFTLTRIHRQPQPLSVRDVTFQNGSVTLAGTLIEPSANHALPAILFLQGSGPEGRWANRYFAERFARAGFAALIFDKRGVAQSTGDWQTADFQDLADDAASGIRFLQSQKEIDPKRIGIYGHSQGGTLAPLVAIRAHGVAFVIASAAGGIAPAQLEEYSIGNDIGIPSLPANEAADAKVFTKAIVDVAYRGHPRSELDAVAARFKSRSWYFDPPPPDNYYWAWSRRIAEYNPAKFWRRVNVPVLLLFGTRDERVPPKPDADAIVAALHAGGNKNVTVRMFADASHTFTLPSAGAWPKYAPGYADGMAGWARAVASQIP